ncbi:hypothetical protein SAMN02745866_02012 [Alteromonadaceae bacterium Bs31]|nr:hypothetical protein SAMN02745866_02012 [Alteromonadaceae bacterium Bs31]
MEKSIPPINNEVLISPVFESITPQRLSREYPWLTVFSAQLILLILPVLLFFLDEQFIEHLRYLAPFVAAAWLGLSAFMYLHCRAKGYQLRDQDVSLYLGLVFKKTIIQPISRLQHIEVTQGPLERMFGLATLKLFSAGGASHSLTIPGLKKETAEGLREHILDSKGLAVE